MLVVRWLPLRGVGAVLQDMQEAVPYRRHSIGGAETTRPSLSGRSALCMRAAEEEKEALQKPLFPSRIEQNCSVRFFFTTSKNGVFLPSK